MKSNVSARTGLLFLCFCALVSAQSVVINEVNSGSPDFIEYRNQTVAPVDISGWTQASWYATGAGPMTAEPTLLFPAATVLAPGGFLVTADGGAIPGSIISGFNYFWVADRTVEVALLDGALAGVDYMLYDFFGNGPTGNIPAPTGWAGVFSGAGSDDKSRNSDVDTDNATDWTAIGGGGTPNTENPGQLAPFAWDATIACGAGTVDFSVVNGTPGNSCYIATAAVSTGVAPSGWFYGVDIAFAELVAQVQLGFPFVGVIGAGGSFTFPFAVPPGCGSFGIPLDYVGLEYAAGTTALVQASAAKTVLL